MDREQLIGLGIWFLQVAGYTVTLGAVGIGFTFAFFVGAGGW